MPTLIDGHAHLYRCHDPRSALDAAAHAFTAVAAGLGIEAAGVRGCLILVDPVGTDGFGRLTEEGARGWSVSPVGEESLVATRDADGAGLVVIGGRQIRTQSGLEVLAYGSRARFEDGGALPDRIEEVVDAGAVPVVPWGFGKWLGRRGTIVEGVLRSSLSRHVLLADSYTRPRAFPMPRLLRLAGHCGVRVIAGTDPLPFPGQESTVGRYGFMADFDLVPDDAAGVLKTFLAHRGAEVRPYGRRASSLPALWLQVGMQARRWTARRRRRYGPADEYSP